MLRWRVVLASGLVMGLGWTSPAVASEEATSLGKQYSDTDSRYAARAMRERLAALGYASTQDLNGRSALETYYSLRRSSVFFFSGHATGAFLLSNGSNVKGDPNHHWLSAGESNDLPACGGPAHSYLCDDRFAWVSHAPYVALDDTRLLIAKGCDTADLFTESPDYGSFREISRGRGIDSFLGWRGTVYSPAAGQPIEQTNYSGNYFAKRLAIYLARGRSYRVSVDRAITDLVAREGRAWGYQRYVFDGALSDPGSPTLRGAPAGRVGNGAPLSAVGVGAATAVAPLAEATSTMSHPTYGAVSEHITADRLSYRMTAQGKLLDLSGVAANTGPEVTDHQGAQEAALEFIHRNVADLPRGLTLHRSGQISHMTGDSISEFEWRPRVDGIPGPRTIRVEVDRKTGRIVSFYDVAASSIAATFTVDRDAAVKKAAALVAAGGAVTVEPDVWETSRWTVTFDRGVDDQGFRDSDQVVIDATTGDVLQHAAA